MPNKMRVEGGPAKPVVLVNPSGGIEGDGRNTILIAGMDNDGAYRPIELDALSGVLINLGFEHHEIHEGNHYFYTYSESLGDAGVSEFLITTPDSTTKIHFLFDVDGSAILQVDFFEATTKVGTTAQTAYNNNRTSLNVPDLLIYKSASGAGDGTKIYTYKGGSAGATPNQARSTALPRGTREIILMRNTKYLLRLTSGADANLTNVLFEWYEY